MNPLVIGIIIVVGFLTTVILYEIYTEEKPVIEIIKDYVPNPHLISKEQAFEIASKDRFIIFYKTLLHMIS